MIFLAVVRLPVRVRDRCEACDARASHVLFTIGPAHWVSIAGRGEERYAGGPDAFVVCDEHAAAARAIMARETESGSPSATFGRFAAIRSR